MKEKLLKIINHYEVMPQLKHFQSKVFELNEAIIRNKVYDDVVDSDYINELQIKHIAEEIADVLVMLKQFQHYYEIEDKDIEEIMEYKIYRQLGRIINEVNNENN